MNARPLSTYPKDRKTLLTYTKAIAENWEDESMAALEMGSLVEAILLDEAVDPEVQQLAALVAERDALRKALEACGANWSSKPGLLIDCFNDMGEEFQRRIDLARAALASEAQP